KVRDVLRLQVVRAAEGGDPFHIHFGMQKSPIFLLDESPGRQATFFASSSDAEKLLAMQRRHRASVLEDTKTQNRLNADLTAADARLAMLSPLDDLDAETKAASAKYDACLSEAAALDQAMTVLGELKRIVGEKHRWQVCRALLADCRPAPVLVDETPLNQITQRLRQAQREQQRQTAAANALRPLESPPTPQSDDPLAASIASVQTAAGIARRIQARFMTLKNITAPPQMQNEAELADCLARLRTAKAARASVEQMATILQPINAPPVPVDELPLRDRLVALKKATEAVALQRRSAKAIANELAALHQQTAVYIQSNPTCPVCNSPLSVDRLFSSGQVHGDSIGEHDHA
ncbi:MAG: hypothetical protein JO353_08395, partial [Phycisphaerae bacterium]|nr:hypothetical protein [Phycisphaerae bacterium]